MSKIGIVVAEGRRARFITLDFQGEHAAELVEHLKLSNPEDLPPARESGAARSLGEPPWRADDAVEMDEVGQRRLHEFLRRFARKMIVQVRRFIVDQSIDQLLFVAEPHLLGVARLELEHQPFERIRVAQLAADICHLPLTEIRDILTHRGLLPSLPAAQNMSPAGEASSSPPAESSSQTAPAPPSSAFHHRLS
jgi:protein required for attachment to host cells